MKRAFILIACVIFLFGCAEEKTINGTTYDTYGFFNQDSKKNPDIQYEVSLGNVFWGVILVETVIAPIYFFGYDLFEPVGPKNVDPKMKGVIK